MEQLKYIGYGVLILAVAGIIAAVSQLTLGQFKTTVTKCTPNTDTLNLTWGTTSGYPGTCAHLNATNGSFMDLEVNGTLSDEYLTALGGQKGVSNVSAQFGTIGIIMIMIIVIALIAGVFIYLRMD